MVCVLTASDPTTAIKIGWAKWWSNIPQLTPYCSGCMSLLQVTLLEQANLDYLDENRLGKVLALFETTYSKLSRVCVLTATDPTTAS